LLNTTFPDATILFEVIVVDVTATDDTTFEVMVAVDVILAVETEVVVNRDELRIREFRSLKKISRASDIRDIPNNLAMLLALLILAPCFCFIYIKVDVLSTIRFLHPTYKAHRLLELE